MTNERKQDDELPFLIAGNGIFSLAILIVEFTFKHLKEFLGTWYGVVFMVLQIITAALWVIVIVKWKDPNFDYIRKLLCGLLLAALVILLFGRSRWVDEKMFNDEVDKNKTEQRDH